MVELNEVRAVSVYERKPPELSNFECEDIALEKFFTSIMSENTVVCPAEGYFEFEGGLVYEAKHVLLENGEYLSDSVVDFNAKTELKNVILKTENCINWLPDRRTNVFFAKAGASNYGHFLTDCLPKLMNLPLANVGQIRVFIPNESAKFTLQVADLCKYLNLDAVLVLAPEGKAIRTSGIYLSSVAKHNIRKSCTITLMKHAFQDIYGIDKEESNARLFVTRSPSEIRSLKNGHEIEALVKDAGYRIVNPRGMSFREQVRLFSAASIIAGPLGAGLANLLWCREDTKSLMIDPGLCDFYFWDLGARYGSKFVWHFTDVARRYSEEMEQDPFTVNAVDLASTMTEHGLL